MRVREKLQGNRILDDTYNIISLFICQMVMERIGEAIEYDKYFVM